MTHLRTKDIDTTVKVKDTYLLHEQYPTLLHFDLILTLTPSLWLHSACLAWGFAASQQHHPLTPHLAFAHWCRPENRLAEQNHQLAASDLQQARWRWTGAVGLQVPWHWTGAVVVQGWFVGWWPHHWTHPAQPDRSLKQQRPESEALLHCPAASSSCAPSS